MRHAVLIGEAFIHKMRKHANCIFAHLLYREKGRDKDDPGDMILHRKGDGRTGTNRPPEDENAVQRPFQYLAHEAEDRKGVLCDLLLIARTTRADTVSGVLHSKDMNLKLFPEDGAKGIALPNVLSVAVEVEDEEPCRGIREE